MKITLINIEWNSWNGLIFEILNIEAGIKEGTFFGINLDKSFCYVDLLFFNFKIWQKKIKNPLDNCESHKETIICPECSELQEAIVYHTIPFLTAVHECTNCKNTIMESEWQRVES